MKAVSDKVIQQTTDPIECPPGGGDPATEPDAAAVGADTVNKATATAPKKIFVCSPYRPTSKTEECRKDELMANINRAKTACRILTTLGFLPMAPHLYFTQFSPYGGGRPTGALAKAIDATWGSFENFQKEFVAAGTGLFGSGWVWLAKDKDGKLSITKEANGSNPVAHGLKPILGFDVWEHAYYLDYRNRRPDHLNALWKIIDWDTVGKRY